MKTPPPRVSRVYSSRLCIHAATLPVSGHMRRRLNSPWRIYEALSIRRKKELPMEPAKPCFRNAFTQSLSSAMLGLSLLGLAPAPELAPAARPGEPPLIPLDAPADITDFFMFRSYETGKDDKIVLIMNVFPGGEPSSGPNYFSFDPNVRYAFHLDNNLDGKAEDIEFEFQFRTEVRGLVDQLGLFVSYLGCGT